MTLLSILDYSNFHFIGIYNTAIDVIPMLLYGYTNLMVISNGYLQWLCRMVMSYGYVVWLCRMVMSFG